MKIFLVIPLFNEKKYISSVLEDVSKFNLPIVVVDDGSVDNSQLSIFNFQKEHKNINLLIHKINLGKGAAMKTGADYAFNHGADGVIFMDSDNQHVAGDLPVFIKALESGKYDVVLGSRNFGYGVPLIRFLGNKFASLLMVFLFKTYVSDVICGFRGMTKSGYEKIKWDSAGYGVETEMIARIGKNKVKFCEVPVKAIYHDSVKGVTILDAFGIFGQVVKWRLTI
jgi:glycosyltransferase involved in cell wall biosynthesis